MQLQQILEEIPKLGSEDSDRFRLKALLPLLSGVSKQTLLELQQNWDSSKPFDEFVAAQNAEFVMCLRLEISDIGSVIRKSLGMDPLTLETEVEWNTTPITIP